MLCGISCLSFISDYTLAGPVDPDIDIYYPSGGSWYEGDDISILWDYTFDSGEYVEIEVYANGYFYYTVNSNTSNDGDYSWTIPSDVATDYSYQIKITSLAYSDVYDYSDYFSMYERSITITSPSGGETWYTGKSYYVNWDSTNAGNYFDIALYKSGSHYQIIASNTYNYGGYYLWTVPDSLPISSSYKIKITSNSFANVYDYSWSFSIDEQSITITSPQENETWYRGETHTITWDSKNAGGYVKIGYGYGSPYSYYTITSNTSNDGTYSWAIPSGLASRTNYKIYIESLSDSTIADWGEYFSIDERLIIIISPKSGATWYKEDDYTIWWEAENIGSSVEISLYQDGWPVATINATTENDGECTWTIPSNISSSSSCKIKIKSIAYTNIYGISDYFTIDERSIAVDNPDEETWYLGETYEITWDSEGAGSYVNIELYENGEYAFTIATNTENDGYYQWTIPSSLSTGLSYTIQITSTAYDNVSASSGGEIAIEETMLQQWSGTIIFIIAVIIILVVGVLIVKKFIMKPASQPEENDQDETEEPTPVIPREVTSEKISEDEYEQIWENKRP
jgi:uncharacterized membrane protein